MILTLRVKILLVSVSWNKRWGKHLTNGFQTSPPNCWVCVYDLEVKQTHCICAASGGEGYCIPTPPAWLRRSSSTTGEIFEDYKESGFHFHGFKKELHSPEKLEQKQTSKPKETCILIVSSLKRCRDYIMQQEVKYGGMGPVLYIYGSTCHQCLVCNHLSVWRLVYSC